MPNVSLLICGVAERLLGVHLRDVIETLRPLPIRPLAGAPAFVAGVSLIRGTVMPVVDLGLLTRGQASARRRLVTLRLGTRCVALAVDDVVGVREISADTLASLPSLVDPQETSPLQGLGDIDGQLLMVLQSARVLPEDFWSGFQDSERAA